MAPRGRGRGRGGGRGAGSDPGDSHDDSDIPDLDDSDSDSSSDGSGDENQDAPGDDGYDEDAANLQNLDVGVDHDAGAHPGEFGWVKPSQPPPHGKYHPLRPRRPCGRLQFDGNEPVVDARGEQYRCMAPLWRPEEASRACCHDGACMLPPVPMPADRPFVRLYDVSGPAFRWSAACRRLNFGCSFSLMGTTTGQHQQGWHHHGNPGYSFYKLQGLTYHSVNLGKQNPTRCWTVNAERPGAAQGPNLVPAQQTITDMLRRYNDLYGKFRQVQQILDNAAPGGEVPVVNIVFRGQSGTTAGGPAADEMANLARGADNALRAEGYHVMSMKKNALGAWANRKLFLGQPNFEELQYPLLFPTGAGGWFDYYVREYVAQADGALQARRRQADDPRDPRVQFTDVQGHPVTFAAYCRKRLLCEPHFWKSASLMNQWVLDMYASEQGRKLKYEQKRTARNRLVNRAGVQRVAQEQAGQDVPAAAVGKPFHSSSFTGSPAYYSKNKRKALAVLARTGRPSYFITMTCNPRWTEITDALLPGQQWNDRPDLVDRVFKLKKEDLLKQLRKGTVFRKRNPTGGRDHLNPCSAILWVRFLCYEYKDSRRGVR